MTRPSLRRLADKIEAARNAADDERFNLGHAAGLLALLGEQIGEHGADEESGLRVEYLARQIKRHGADLAAALVKIERVAMAMRRGEVEEPAAPNGGVGNVIALHAEGSHDTGPAA